MLQKGKSRIGLFALFFFFSLQYSAWGVSPEQSYSFNLSPIQRLSVYKKHLYFLVDHKVKKLSLNAELLWSPEHLLLSKNGIAFQHNRLFFLDKDGYSNSVDLSYGLPIWGPRPYSSTKLLVSYPYVFSQGKGVLYAFDFHTGSLLWKKSISGRMYKGLLNELLIVENAVIRHLSVETGTVLRTLSLPVSPKKVIVSHNNYVLVNSADQLFFYDGVSRKIRKINTDKNRRFVGSFQSVLVFYDSKKETVYLNSLSSELKSFYHFRSEDVPKLIEIKDRLEYFALSIKNALYLFNTDTKRVYLLENLGNLSLSSPLLDLVLDEDSIYLIYPSTIDKYLISGLAYKNI